ncbi:MAG: hypothetical protein GXO89_04855 [Chlorobi bacterium]|nr:hypothetical protein [Chlorobiota bacterium]
MTGIIEKSYFSKVELRDIFKKDSYKGVSGLRVFGAIGVGMGLSAICLGILFKLEHWPGSNFNLMIGLVTTLIVSIIALIKFFKSKDNYYKQILKRTAIIGGLGLLLTAVPDLTLQKIQYRNHPEYIKAYEEYLSNQENKELKQKLELEYKKATMTEKEFEIYQKYQEPNKQSK